MFSQNDLLAETGKLQKFAFRLTKNKYDADDLLQSTCLRALEKADGFEEGTNLFGWTSKIMFNIFASSYRRRTKFECQYDPESYVDKTVVASAQEASTDLSLVKKAMMKLSADHRRVLVLICVKGMHYKEVSEMLQIPVGTVRSRLSRAREELQSLMSVPSVSRNIKAATRALANSENYNMPLIPAYIASHVLGRTA